MARKRETATVDGPTPDPEMVVESVSIDDLHQDPANARKHDQKNLSAIKASLARFGQQTPVVIDAKNVVRKGNGTLEAARELGWAAIKVVRTSLVGVDAVAYAIADNRTSDLSEFDDVILAETLEAIRSEPDFPLEATGYTDSDLAALLEGLADEVAGTEGDNPSHDEGSVDELSERYEIIVECDDEAQQRTVFDRLQSEGLRCRVVTF